MKTVPGRAGSFGGGTKVSSGGGFRGEEIWRRVADATLVQGSDDSCGVSSPVDV